MSSDRTPTERFVDLFRWLALKKNAVTIKDLDLLSRAPRPLEVAILKDLLKTRVSTEELCSIARGFEHVIHQVDWTSAIRDISAIAEQMRANAIRREVAQRETEPIWYLRNLDTWPSSGSRAIRTQMVRDAGRRRMWCVARVDLAGTEITVLQNGRLPRTVRIDRQFTIDMFDACAVGPMVLVPGNTRALPYRALLFDVLDGGKPFVDVALEQFERIVGIVPRKKAAPLLLLGTWRGQSIIRLRLASPGGVEALSLASFRCRAIVGAFEDSAGRLIAVLDCERSIVWLQLFGPALGREPGA